MIELTTNIIELMSQNVIQIIQAQEAQSIYNLNYVRNSNLVQQLTRTLEYKEKIEVETPYP